MTKRLPSEYENAKKRTEVFMNDLMEKTKSK